MKSPTLEHDLQRYAKRRSKNLFHEKLYDPLNTLIDWVISKEYNCLNLIAKQDIKQLIMVRIIKDIKYYKPDRGAKAFSFVRMLISQELHKNKRKLERIANMEDEYCQTSHVDKEAQEAANETSIVPISVSEMLIVLAKYKDTTGITGDSSRVIGALIGLLQKDYMLWLNATAIQKIQLLKLKTHATNQTIRDTLEAIKKAQLITN